MAGLTAKQKRFVDEYLVDLNATQAAIRAGYSVSAATEIGHENLRKPHIRDEVDKAMAERSKRTGITADRVLEELAKIGFCNALDIIDFETAEVLPSITREDAACIQSIKVKTTVIEDRETVEKEVKLYDKQRSLDSLCRHLGLFNDRLDLNADVGVTIVDNLVVADG